LSVTGSVEEGDAYDPYANTNRDQAIAGSRDESSYAMVYTCGICDQREVKKFSKHSYHSGVVIIRCSSCGSRHLIADHLNWFDDRAQTIETIMEEQGETVTKKIMPSNLFEERLKQGVAD